MDRRIGFITAMAITMVLAFGSAHAWQSKVDLTANNWKVCHVIINKRDTITQVRKKLGEPDFVDALEIDRGKKRRTRTHTVTRWTYTRCDRTVVFNGSYVTAVE